MRASASLARWSLAVSALAWTAAAHAQAPIGPTEGPPAAAPKSVAPPHVFSFTVSGGVSLGAYEAGTLYFLTEAIKRSRGQFELRIATGASAGGANALIALMDSCRAPVDDPTRSLGFDTWIPVGIAQLFDPAKVTPISVLNRGPLRRALARLAHRFREGLRADCDVVFGVSVTRKEPSLASLSDPAFRAALEVPRAGERFIVRIQGRGPGRVPKLSNYVDPHAPLPQPLLPFASGDDDTSQAYNFGRLCELLFASAAFPLAFPPYPLTHCETDPTQAANGGGASLACDKPVKALFIDGGVFDNTPLRLNYRIVQRGLRADADGRIHWLDVGVQDNRDPPPVRYSYVDPSSGAFPPLDSEDETERPQGAIDLTLELASSFIHASRQRELLALLEESPHGRVGEGMGLTQNELPTISGQLGAFFGFFERDFRVLDFYIGMYDGFISTRRYLSTLESPASAEARIAADFPVFARPLRPDLPKGLRPLACLLSQVEPEYAGHASACAGEELHNFRILLQVTLDRLHAACARTPPSELPPHASPLCANAARGGARVLVPGVPVIAAESCGRATGELDFGYSLRLLGEYGFTFRDLGLRADEAHYGKVKIRRKLLSMATALADAQPSNLTGALIQTAGRAGANLITYEPPKNWIYVTAGTALEVGASLLPFSWNESWARLNLALQISRWETLSTPERLALSFSPLAGPELQLLFLSNPTLQWMLGARAGYQASVRDAVGIEPCGDDEALGDARNCSQFVLQGYLAAAVIERLRLQFVAEFFPTNQATDFESRTAFQLSFGLQLF